MNGPQPYREKQQGIPLERNFIYEGYSLRLYSIGWLAYMCNRSQVCIRKWQRNGVLPRPIFDLNDGRRWYSVAELLGYSKIIRESNIRPGKQSLFAVKEWTARYKLRLKKLYEQEPQKIRAEFPEEFSIKDLMRRHKEAYWKSQALKLVNELAK
jgi:hypothetical protein